MNLTLTGEENSHEGIGSSDNILVEERCSPGLTGNEGASEDTDEESDDVDAVDRSSRASERRGDSTEYEKSSHDLPRKISNPISIRSESSINLSWSVAINERTDDESYTESCE